MEKLAEEKERLKDRVLEEGAADSTEHGGRAHWMSRMLRELFGKN